MDITCPHCHTPILISAEIAEEVCCLGCGSSFRVENATLETTKELFRSVGKFQIMERVGAGAFGTVYRARDTDLDRIVAVKIAHPSLLVSEHGQERFLRESRAAAQLRHTGIVPVHEVTEIDGMPAIISDFVDGLTLQDLLRSRGLPFREAARIVADVSDALHYAHAQGLIHRDIKPANVMLEFASKAPVELPELERSRSKAMVLDFGLALRPQAEVTMTMDGQIIGTPAYMSPEQASGRSHQVDARTDVYSLGVVLYELICGELPFRGSKVMMIHQVLREEPRAPRQINDGIPRDLETICLKAMEKSTARRYATARELADDLRRYLDGKPVRARRTGRVTRTWRWCRREPLVAVLSAAVLVVFLSGFTGVLWQWHRAEDNFRQARSNLKTARWERDRADKGERAARRNLYDAHINIAFQALSRGQTNIVDSLLERYRTDSGGEDFRTYEWYLLWKFLHSDLKSFQAHSGELLSLALSGDGSLLITGGADGVAKLWSLPKCSERVVLSAHVGAVTSVAISSDQKLAATAGTDKTIRLWDTSSGEERATMADHHCPINDIAFSLDGSLLAAGGGKDGFGELKIWDLSSQQVKWSLRGHPDVVTAVCFHPHDFLMASVGHDNVVRLWDVDTGREMIALRDDRTEPQGDLPVAALGTLDFSPDGKTLAVSGDGYGVALWDLRTNKQSSGLSAFWGASSVAFSPDGSTLAVANRGNSLVTLWDASQQAIRAKCMGHSDRVLAVGFAGKGTLMATGCADGMVRLWDPSKLPGFRSTFPWKDGQIHRIALSRDGHSLATLRPTEGRLAIHEKDTGRTKLRRFRPSQHSVSGLAFSPSGDTIAASTAQKYLWIAETHRNRVRRSFQGSEAIWSFCYSPDGSTLAIARNRRLELWDTQTEQLTKLLAEHDEASELVSFSAEGLLAEMRGDRVRLWNPATGEQLHKLELEDSGVGHRALAFSSDGTLLAAAKGCVVAVWNVSSGHLIADWRAGERAIAAMVFSPDSRSLITADLSEAGIVFWDSITGQRRGRIGYRGTGGLVFSPEGTTLYGLDRANGASQVTFELQSAPTGSGAENGFVKIYRNLLAHSPQSDFLQRCSALALRNDAARLKKAGRPKTALSLTREAVDGWERLVEDDPSNPHNQKGLSAAQELLGDLLIVTERCAEAIDLASAALKVIPQHPGWLSTLGRAQYRSNKFVQAKNTLERALKHRESVWGTYDDHFFLAMACWQSGEKEMALASYHDALTMVDDQFGDHTVHSEARLVLNDPETTPEFALLVTSSVVEDDDRLLKYASMLPLSGDVEGYRRLCRDALRRFAAGASPATAYRLAMLCIMCPESVEDRKQVISLALRGIEDSPDISWRRFALAMAYCRDGQFALAAQHLRTSMNCELRMPDVLNWLGLAISSARLGQALESRFWLDKAENWIVASPHRLYEIHLHGRGLCELLLQEARATVSRTTD